MMEATFLLLLYALAWWLRHQGYPPYFEQGMTLWRWQRPWPPQQPWPQARQLALDWSEGRVLALPGAGLAVFRPRWLGPAAVAALTCQDGRVQLRAVLDLTVLARYVLLVVLLPPTLAVVLVVALLWADGVALRQDKASFQRLLATL